MYTERIFVHSCFIIHVGGLMENSNYVGEGHLPIAVPDLGFGVMFDR